MNQLVCQYFQSDHFEEALILNEQPEKTWGDLIQFAPNLPRGWFELSRLSSRDRIDFSRDFWSKALPYRPSMHRAIHSFFEGLDDVGPILTLEGRWMPHMVYSFKDNSCFFQGFPPAKPEDRMDLEKEINVRFPSDWNGFLKIHDGFGKLLDTGILPLSEIGKARHHVMNMLLQAEYTVYSGEQLVDPCTLIPFYEACGFNSFQCFFADWYPEGEMGNVYFSGIDYTLSDTGRQRDWEDSGAFPSFSDWLVSFLEGMNIAR